MICSMKGTIKALLLVFLLFFCKTAFAQPAYYTVTAQDLNVRSGPGTHYPVLIQLHKGETFIVQRMYDSDWAVTKVASTTCYVSRKYISYKGPVTTQEQPNQQQSKQRQQKSKAKTDNEGIGDVGIFWICFLLSFVLYILSFEIERSNPIASVIVNLLSATSLIIWTNICDECFWFLDFEHQNLLVFLLCMFLTALFIGFIWGTAWNNIKLIKDIRYEPLSSIIFFFIGCVWGYLLLRLIGIFFDEHPIMSFFALAGACTSERHIPTIYVPGEGNITGHGHHGGDEFTGDNGYEYWYDGKTWHPRS